MDEPFVGEMQLVAFTVVPRDWAACNGQLLPIATNQALFALLGTTYGGDGRTNFALPDLRGRTGIHQSPSLPMGAAGGVESVTLSPNQIPERLVGGPQLSRRPGNGAALATPGAYRRGPGTVGLGAVGAGQPHNNLPPYLTLQWIIALTGVFPPRA